jgi:hypothetical protein
MSLKYLLDLIRRRRPEVVRPPRLLERHDWLDFPAAYHHWHRHRRPPNLSRAHRLTRREERKPKGGL